MRFRYWVGKEAFMRYGSGFAVLLTIVCCLLVGATRSNAQRTVPSTTVGLNRIEGRITNESSMPVYNAYVELYNNLGSIAGRQRSSAQGTFSFRGMGPGRYTITIKPFGTNLREDSREIEVNNQAARSDTVIVDFRLRKDNRFDSDDIGIVGTVFAQETPPDARRLFNSGVEDFGSKREKAITQFEEAVKLFPTYFDALLALGKAHILGAAYEKGYPFLLRALDVNVKCSDCYFSLGIAFYKLNEISAGVKAAEAAIQLRPQSPAAHLLLGMLYRTNSELNRAERSLLMAKSLSKEENSEIHWQLSLVYNRLNRNSEAARELEAYLRAEPDLPDAEKRDVRNLIAKLKSTK